MRELLLGLRLAATGGRNARLRAAMTAFGVGLGVVVLLFAASVPSMIREGDQRSADREGIDLVAGQKHGDTLQVGYTNTEYRGNGIRGRLIAPDGPNAPVPPGLRGLPGPGELVVSPALGELLNSSEGRLLRERLNGPIAGTIGDVGLRGPRELTFYEGARPGAVGSFSTRITGFGRVIEEAVPPFLVLILAVGVVVLLLPVAVFIATAARFGSDERDRRLAALRLVGADRAMAIRIAAGETLFGALGGLIVGAVLFGLLRPQVQHFSLQDISVFAADVQPAGGLTLLTLIGVPAATVAAAIFSLRRVVVEPLGVVRRGADARRRLWWRLIPLALGALLLLELGPRDLLDGSDGTTIQASVGVLLALIGLTAILPWAVEAALRRVRGGPVALQLATRRLQMDGGTAARVVSGVAVAVAGAIALQSILTAGQQASTTFTGADLSRADMVIGASDTGTGGRAKLQAALDATRGVERATVIDRAYARNGDHQMVEVGDCAALRTVAAVPDCRDGAAYVTPNGPEPGRVMRLRGGNELTVPDATPTRMVRTPDGSTFDALLLTPAAAAEFVPDDVESYLVLDDTADAVEYARNTAFAFSRGAYVSELRPTTELTAYRSIKRGLYAGAVIVLFLIGASLLVGGLEQLRERKPVLAALGAFGAPRGTLALSVLWQAAIPVVVGLAVAILIGIGLAGLLLSIGGSDMTVDWAAVAGLSGAGGAVILLVTLATLPAVSRLMRPEGLRTE